MRIPDAKMFTANQCISHVSMVPKTGINKLLCQRMPDIHPTKTNVMYYVISAMMIMEGAVTKDAKPITTTD